MGKFFSGGETYRVTFPDGEWIDVKQEFSQADQDYMLDQMAHAEATGKDAKLSFSLGKLAMLERGIVAWSFTGDSDKPVPVNRDTINTLRLRYRAKILEEINRLNEEAARFLGPTPATASTSPSTGS